MTDDRSGDGGDDGVSSEDLLKAAKSQFGLDDGSSGVADSLLESSLGDTSGEAAEVMPSLDEIAAALAGSATPDTDFATTPDTDFATTPDTDFATTPDTDFAADGDADMVAAGSPEPDRDVTRGSDDLIGDTRAPRAPDVPEAEEVRFTVPDPGIPTGLPPEPLEVDADEVLAGLPVPPETAAAAGGLLSVLWRNRWIVVVAVIGISVLAGILDQSKPIQERSPGECFNNPRGDEVSEIDLIDCADPHDLEVFANVSLTGGAFPGDDALVEQAFGSCLDFFEPYVGEPYETSILYMFPFTPAEGTWNDGERNAVCVVFEPVAGTAGAEIKARTGSVRGSGL
jgi:hypothetical protein